MQQDQALPFRTGSCVCRSVTFRTLGEPLRVGICHCADCRKTSGAPFSAFAIWSSNAFELTSGNLGTYGGRCFCVTCGSRVFSTTGDEVEVMIGSFDAAPTDLIPEYELWIGRREPWLSPLPDTAQFEGDRMPIDPLARMES